MSLLWQDVCRCITRHILGRGDSLSECPCTNPGVAHVQTPSSIILHERSYLGAAGGDVADTKDRTKQKACLERYRKACIQILGVLNKAAPQVGNFPSRLTAPDSY